MAEEPQRKRPAVRKTKDGGEEHVRYELDPAGPWRPLVRIVVKAPPQRVDPVIVVPMRDAAPGDPEWPKRTVGALVAKLAGDDGALVRVTYSMAILPPSKVSKTGDWKPTHVHVVRVVRHDGRGWGAWYNGRWEDGQWWHQGDPMPVCVPLGGDWERLALGAHIGSQVLAKVG